MEGDKSEGGDKSRGDICRGWQIRGGWEWQVRGGIEISLGVTHQWGWQFPRGDDISGPVTWLAMVPRSVPRNTRTHGYGLFCQLKQKFLKKKLLPTGNKTKLFLGHENETGTKAILCSVRSLEFRVNYRGIPRCTMTIEDASHFSQMSYLRQVNRFKGLKLGSSRKSAALKFLFLQKWFAVVCSNQAKLKWIALGPFPISWLLIWFNSKLHFLLNKQKEHWGAKHKCVQGKSGFSVEIIKCLIPSAKALLFQQFFSCPCPKAILKHAMSSIMLLTFKTKEKNAHSCHSWFFKRAVSVEWKMGWNTGSQQTNSTRKYV